MSDSEKNTIETLEASGQGKLHSKSITYVGIFAGLGALLSLLSTMTLPIGPGVSVDLSHVGTYMIALVGGPLLGLLGGTIVGVIPAFQYANPMVIPGKAMTGVTVGLVSLLFQRIPAIKGNQKLLAIVYPIAGILGYVPEYIFTAWNLDFLGMPEPVIISILTKAWIEIAIITALTTFILSIPAVREGTHSLVGKDAKLEVPDYLASGIVVLSSIFFIMAFLMSTGFSFFTSGMLVETFLGWLIGIGIILGVLVIALIINYHKTR
ncbi:MAG: hypothetical protein ACTSUE_10960 [Promethearchaeota archaeon]